MGVALGPTLRRETRPVLLDQGSLALGEQDALVMLRRGAGFRATESRGNAAVVFCVGSCCVAIAAEELGSWGLEPSRRADSELDSKYLNSYLNSKYLNCCEWTDFASWVA